MGEKLSVVGLYDGLESGCNYYRLIMPFAQLKNSGYRFDWLPFEENVEGKYDSLRKNYYHMVTLIRPLIKVVQEQPGIDLAWDLVDRVHQNRSLIGGDIDDDYWNIPDTNPVKKEFTPENLAIMRRTFKLLDYITVSTEFLARRVIEETGVEPSKVHVLPNMIDFDLFDNEFELEHEGKKYKLDLRQKRFDRLTRNEEKHVVIGLQGGNSHYEDWKLIANPLKRIYQEFGSKVKFLIAGYHPDYLKEALATAIENGDCDLDGWKPFDLHPTTVGMFDINLAPLQDGIFNQSKSGIKYLEAGAVGAVTVASPNVYADYIQPGQTGLIAQSEEDFYRAIRFLILNREVRQELGKNAHMQVRSFHSLQANVHRFLNLYRQIWDTKKPEVLKRWMVELENQQFGLLKAA